MTLDEVRAKVSRIVGIGDDEVVSTQLLFTPRGKRVLELALREALALGHNYVGTEHVLLGLVRENEGVATRMLYDLDADAETVRDTVIRYLSGPKNTPPKPTADPVEDKLVDAVVALLTEVPLGDGARRAIRRFGAALEKLADS